VRPATRLERGLSHALIVAGGVLVMVPFFWMLSTSLKPEWEAFQIPPAWLPEEPLWQNYHDAVFKYFNFLQYGLNTLTITLSVLVGRVLSASLVAFGFARVRFVGRSFLFMLVLSTLMVPHQVTIIPLYILFKEVGWLNTFLPLIVPAWFGGSAFSIFLLRQFIMTVNPELDDAARIDGCGWFGIYARIVMPLIRPALAAVAIFQFLQHWNDFFLPVIYINSRDNWTLALALNALRRQRDGGSFNTDLEILMAATVVVMIAPLAVFFVAQKYFIQGIVFTGVKG
jgi:multiple sugar transport system permease protein